jgi:hypothetical protein
MPRRETQNRQRDATSRIPCSPEGDYSNVSFKPSFKVPAQIFSTVLFRPSAQPRSAVLASYVSFLPLPPCVHFASAVPETSSRLVLNRLFVLRGRLAPQRQDSSSPFIFLFYSFSLVRRVRSRSLKGLL